VIGRTDAAAVAAKSSTPMAVLKVALGGRMELA
jgi:hypothetical protein